MMCFTTALCQHIFDDSSPSQDYTLDAETMMVTILVPTATVMIRIFDEIWSILQMIKSNSTYLCWVNCNDLTATSLEMMVSKGNHPQVALMQVSELL